MERVIDKLQQSLRKADELGGKVSKGDHWKLGVLLKRSPHEVETDHQATRHDPSMRRGNRKVHQNLEATEDSIRRVWN